MAVCEQGKAMLQVVHCLSSTNCSRYLTCPLSCRSGTAPDGRDVLGTLMLVGHTCYVRITGLRRAMVRIAGTA